MSTKENKNGKDQKENNAPATPVDPNAEAAKILAEAEAKAAEIVAKAEAAAKAKVNTVAKAETADPMEELVDYTAPLLPNMKKRDVFVAVNGETLRIQRGIPVKIKRKFFNALQNAAKQEYAAMAARQEIQKQGEKPLAAM